MNEQSIMTACIYAKVLDQLRKTYWQKILSRVVLKELEFNYICRNCRCCECDETFAGKFIENRALFRSSDQLFNYISSNKRNTTSHINYDYMISVLMTTSIGYYCNNCIPKYYDVSSSSEYEGDYCGSCGDDCGASLCRTCRRLDAY